MGRHRPGDGQEHREQTAFPRFRCADERVDVATGAPDDPAAHEAADAVIAQPAVAELVSGHESALCGKDRFEEGQVCIH